MAVIYVSSAKELTHRGFNKMAAILQTTVS